jgi:hypothetical protein
MNKKLDKGCQRGFYWSTKAWFAKDSDEDEVMFGMYYGREGGTDGEMAMRWIEIGKKAKVPRLEIFDDAWKTLSIFLDLITELAKYDNENIAPDKFVEILKSHNFKDLTPYENPYKHS